MLYTFSKAHYDPQELAAIVSQVRATDAVILWQDGVLQAVKNPQLFANIQHCFVLQNDVVARSLTVDLPQISLGELVQLTEQYYPQIAL